jgi:putative aldouronate transport system substrate-binding protein
MKADNGQVIHGAIKPENVQALETLNKWYKDGVLPVEFPTVTYDNIRSTMMGNRVGIWQLMYWGPEWMLDLYRAFPEAKIVVAGPPAGPNGQRGRRMQNSAHQMVGWRKGVEREKIEAMIVSLNWQLERKEQSAENADYGFLFCNHDPLDFEGYDYEWADDNTIKQGPTTTLHWGSPVEHPMGFNPTVTTDAYARMDKFLSKDPEDMNPFEQYIALGPAAGSRYAHKSITDHPETMIKDESDGIIPSQRMQEVTPDMAKLYQETFLKMIVGDTPISDFDQYVETWKQIGGAEVTAEVNEWYAQNRQ